MNRLALSLSVALASSLPSSVVSASSRLGTQIHADSAERARVVHVLNRLGYGPRPGDVDRVLATGLDRYIEQQLHHERIDDRALERSLKGFEILTLSKSDLHQIYQNDRMLRRRAQEARGSDSTGDRARELESTLRESRARIRSLAGEMQQLVVVRATLSERQLHEVLVDFWTNHFNVFLAKGPTRFLMRSHIEDVIRLHAMGSFEELLIATAQSPAMLVYLDNAHSVAPGSRPPELERAHRRLAMGQLRFNRRPIGSLQMNNIGAQAERLRVLEERLPKGLNENYARELLELHTLGVDGGYTQDDVIGVARILTGWSVRILDGEFVFNEWAHDDGDKLVMGHRFPRGRAMEEGVELLRMLASHPATMRHVSQKLCERFVADDPPLECVDASVREWKRTNGDIPSIVSGIIGSPVFWMEEYGATKMKTPLEFVVSSVRALGATPTVTTSLAAMVGRLGQPIYLQQPPTGYPETQESWVSSGALLDRVNLALRFVSGRMQGTDLNLDVVAAVTTDVDALVERVNQNLLHGNAVPNTLDVMHQQASTASSPVEARALVIALALGSPEFQRQ